MIRFACPTCGKSIKIADEYAGRSGKCPGCKMPVTVPAAAPLTAEQSAAEPSPSQPTAEVETAPATIDVQPAQPRQSKKKEKEDKSPDFYDTWWGKLIGGAFMLGLASWLYYSISQMEADGGNMRIWWGIALAYKLGGKWGAVGLIGGFGIIFLLWGMNQVRTGKE